MYTRSGLFIITFLMIFGWKIAGYIDISSIVACILVFRLLWRPETVKKLKSDISIKCLYYLSIYSIFLSIFTGIEDIQIVFRTLRAFIVLIASYSLYELYCKKLPDSHDAIVSDVFFSLFTHSLIMVSMFSSDSIRNAIYAITEASSYVNNSSSFLDGYRVSGLTYGLSQTSVLQMFGLFLIPTMIKKSNNTINRIFLLATIPITIASVLISGRSGLFIGILLFPVYIICKYLCNPVPLRNLQKNIPAAIVYIALLLVFAQFTYKILPQKFHQYTMSTNSEIFEALAWEGHTISHVSDHMYFFPDNICEMLFGTGNLGRSEYNYIDSDVGWVRNIFAVGVIGTVLMLIPYFSGIVIAFCNRNVLGEIAFAAILIFLASLLLNCKELAILTRNQWTVQTLLLAYLHTKRNNLALQNNRHVIHKAD